MIHERIYSERKIKERKKKRLKMRYIPTVVVAFSCDFVVANPILIKKTSIQWNIELYKTRHNELKFEKKCNFPWDIAMFASKAKVNIFGNIFNIEGPKAPQ